VGDNRHTLLVCTVGGTPDPLVKSLLHWQPARIIFVPSAQTRAHVDAVLRGYSEHAGQPLSPGCYRICPVEDAEELQGCLRVVKELDHEVTDWIGRGGDYQVVADFTAGTKCMSAALALQARRWPCQFSYVGGARRTKDGVGVVEAGSERVIHSANPWDALGFQAVEEFIGLFDQQAFAPARAIADKAMRNVSQQSRKRELNALKILAEAYDAWDRFDHKGARSKVQESVKYDNDLQAVLGQPKVNQVRSCTAAHIDYLGKLVEGNSPSMQHVVDLLANARRRKAEGRIDDAVARLYRAIESLAQVALAERYQINNTKQVLLERVPEPLHAQWISRAEQGMVFLALQDAYALLNALGDELGAKFKQLELHDRQKSPLAARNQSILAHGFERVSDKVFEQLWKAALQLAAIQEADLPTFPRFSP
jgi:CRISPR-associated protein (TIGR02710 family)